MNIIIDIIVMIMVLTFLISLFSTILCCRYSPKCRYICCNRCLGYAPPIKRDNSEFYNSIL